MLITLLIMLYTSRVLLDVLGESDFGLYHVLAGVVVLLGFLQGALSMMTQRFVAVELGKEDHSQLSRIFSMSTNIHILFALVIALVALVLGYAFLLDVINYGTTDPDIVMWVFVFSIGTFIMNLVVLPCHAVVVAHEHMKTFAWFGILEAVLKLVVVLVLPIGEIHSLLAYAILLFAVALTMTVSYFVYVLNSFSSIRYQLFWDTDLFKTLASFSGWSMWGNAASVFANQGATLLLNIYFGPAVNAAKSVAAQASVGLNQFVTNLQSAINPQLMKSYSAEDREYTDQLIYYGGKYNFFLIAFLALPVMVYTPDILALWLVEVPDYAALFLRILLAKVVVESVSKPLVTAAYATGRIRLYQFVVGGTLMLNIPIAWLVLTWGAGPEWVFYVAFGMMVISALLRVIMLKRIYEFSARRFTVDVLWPVVCVGVLLGGLAWLVTSLLAADGLLMLLLGIAALMLGTLVIVVFFGFAAPERRALLKLIHRP
ncbi:hypothetical protein CWE21_10775 [Pseudidiomarina aquimaris]|uniref:Lipopolysaccharide biosynthesis protein n=2 Tax=Pseudidiomarina aquimaris TaxID=641841 RepID=A0A432XDA4_9GAMM|nr:hypothetical protein CWE21_10775 [Pseudidiomarina aquimaris]